MSQSEAHEFTRDWWERLPQAYREIDGAQTPGWPLLRFLDGIGDQAGQMRDTSRAMWSGELIDPETAPDRVVPWIAFLLGFSPAQRHTSVNALRQQLVEHSDGTTLSVGTREHIASAARAHLHPGARVQIFASASLPWTLILGVQPEDVPGEDYELLAERLTRSGVVPAGHVIRAQEIRATWDDWEAAAGDTWEAKEQNIRTWTDSDQAGVDLT